MICSRYAGTARLFGKPSFLEVDLRKNTLQQKSDNTWTTRCMVYSDGLFRDMLKRDWNLWVKKKKWLLSMEKARNVSQNCMRGLRGESRAFAECLATVSQEKIQWLLCWLQLCCYKSTDFFCITLDLQHCNQLQSVFGSAGANELYFLTKAHSGDFSLCCHPASCLSSEDKPCPVPATLNE